MIKKLIFVLLFAALTIIAKNKPGAPTVKAHKLDKSLTLDGELNEPVYKNTPIEGFIQKDPDEGKPSSERTNVWVSYDENYFYVSAYLYDSHPEEIDKQIARRDDYIRSDWFGVFIDSFNDDKTGFFFGVNSSGSRVDGTIFNDSRLDDSWDGIWEAATKLQKDGWTVEMKIPFSQLRFKSADKMVWGINFSRLIKRLNEESFYVMVPKTESGFVSLFADLEGLNKIDAKQRIELFPYVVQKGQFLIHDPKDPFYKGKQYRTTLGLDMKVSVGSNLNLDATISPDFGQVEVDPAVVNLSAFETFFPEKRPFFIEGANILRFGSGGSNNNWNFNFGTPTLFYSRRIGGRPHGYTSGGDYVDFPKETRIIGAAKLSGKVNESFSIAALSAFTERTYATIAEGSKRIKEEVEPFTHYGVLRTQKEFNNGKQAVGMILTSVNRNLRSPVLKGLLAKEAYTFGIDGWMFLDEDETYVINASIIGSYVSGTKEFMTGLQQAPYRYFQRPDAVKYTLDENRTNMAGWFSRVMINKQEGNFYFNAALGAISPTFENNDMGFQRSADKYSGHLVLGYRWYDPGEIFRMKQTYFAHYRTYDFEGHPLSIGLMSFSFLRFLNYYAIRIRAGYNFPAIDKGLTRGGPLVQDPEGYFFRLSANSDDRKEIVVSANVGYGGGGSASHFENVGLDVEWKASSQLTLSFGPSYREGMNYHQWVGAFDDPTAVETYGKRYVFGEMKQKTVSAEIRVNWLFTPDMSLQLYLQPFISVGDYNNFNELERGNSYDFRKFGTDESTIVFDENENVYTVDPDGDGPAEGFSFFNPDFNFKSMRANLVFRWEFVPGSFFYLVWSHDQVNFDNPGEFRFNRDFDNLLRAESDDVFLVKFSYWFDI